MDQRDTNSSHSHPHSRPGSSEHQRGVVAGLVYVFEQMMPDPFVLSIGLTLVVIVLAFIFAPHASVAVILTSWYGGTFGILGFALQMILILATGYA
ncbi:MAG: TIGR00366 family protein, partial [Paraburkholderia sp.]|uniref:TIGR00366 family protein n=1 Tax=Paraburkholderia sp. TaxID=1926495 RepID=UPI003C49A3D7